MKPIVIRDGEPAEVEPIEPGGTVRFADPIGEGETIHTIHSEMRTFPASFGCREASFRLSLAPALLERLRQLAAADDAERAEAASQRGPAVREDGVLPRDRSDRRSALGACHVLHPAARGMGPRRRDRVDRRPGGRGVRLLARGAVEARGALPPEQCIDPDALFPELERRGNRIETVTEVLA